VLGDRYCRFPDWETGGGGNWIYSESVPKNSTAQEETKVTLTNHLSQPDETKLRRARRNSKRGRFGMVIVEILVIFPINLRPAPAVERTLNDPRFQVQSLDCVVSRVTRIV
jgi:hypothetical protein